MISIEEKLEAFDFKFKPDNLSIKEGDNCVGRPIFDGQNEIEVVTKLQLAFSIGAPAKEACYFAGISTASYYRYLKKRPEFRNKIKLLQSVPILQARINVVNAIRNKDLKVSIYYLERTVPEEFSAPSSRSSVLEQQKKRIEYLENLLIENKIDFSY